MDPNETKSLAIYVKFSKAIIYRLQCAFCIVLVVGSKRPHWPVGYKDKLKGITLKPCYTPVYALFKLLDIVVFAHDFFVLGQRGYSQQ